METYEQGTIEITETHFTYEISSYNPHGYYKSKSFKISIDEIKVVGIYHTMIFDDDADILVFVDKKNRKYFIPVYFDLSRPDCEAILDLFAIHKTVLDPDNECYDKRINYVLYPKSFQKRPLYRRKNPIESFLWGIFKLFKITYVGNGILTKEVKEFM